MNGNLRNLLNCTGALPMECAYSLGFVQIQDNEVSKQFPRFSKRPANQFSYASEWNNLGTGTIESNGPFGIAEKKTSDSMTQVISITGKDLTIPLVSFVKKNNIPILWLNRAVGLYDQLEFSLIEYFISSHRDGPLLPVIQEQPFRQKIASQRLDCDEDIDSASELFQLYKKRGVPLSLAITTSLLEVHQMPKLPFKVIDNGGSLLSHSHTHPKDWGQSYSEAYYQLIKSANLIKDKYDVEVVSSVSPFHHLPVCAVKAHKDAGYKHTICGLTSRNKHSLNIRSGYHPFDTDDKLIISNQQCMLHGHTILKNNPEEPFIQSLKYHIEHNCIFTYLDHPFSDRYKYDWQNEIARSKVHESLINEIEDSGIKMVNESELLNFLEVKSNIQIELKNNIFKVRPSQNTCKQTGDTKLLPAIIYNNKEYLVDGEITLMKTETTDIFEDN